MGVELKLSKAAVPRDSDKNRSKVAIRVVQNERPERREDVGRPLDVEIDWRLKR